MFYCNSSFITCTLLAPAGSIPKLQMHWLISNFAARKGVIHRYLKQNYLFLTKQNKTKQKQIIFFLCIFLQATLILGSVIKVCMDI